MVKPEGVVVQKTGLQQSTHHFFASKKWLSRQIARIIGYGTEDDILDEQLLDERANGWSIEGDTLYIYMDEGEEDYICYTISSYSAKNEKFFMGTQDGLRFVMAYPEDMLTSDTSIMVLDEAKRRR